MNATATANQSFLSGTAVSTARELILITQEALRDLAWGDDYKVFDGFWKDSKGKEELVADLTASSWGFEHSEELAISLQSLEERLEFVESGAVPKHRTPYWNKLITFLRDSTTSKGAFQETIDRMHSVLERLSTNVNKMLSKVNGELEEIAKGTGLSFHRFEFAPTYAAARCTKCHGHLTDSGALKLIESLKTLALLRSLNLQYNPLPITFYLGDFTCLPTTLAGGASTSITTACAGEDDFVSVTAKDFQPKDE